MTDAEITQIYNIIADYHIRNLKKYGVKLPSLKQGKRYTKDALTLVYLAQGYPSTKIVSKSNLTRFIQEYYPNVNDVQQARHLAAQKGWFILSGTRNDIVSEELRPGNYQLKTLEEPYPGFSAERRNNIIDDASWERLKKQYDNRCACCGSKEGEAHRYWKSTTTVLQKGHLDPRKPLEEQNIIPQCKKCNQPDRNYWVYDKKGRVVNIANAAIIDRCSEELKKEIYKKLYSLYEGKNPEDL